MAVTVTDIIITPALVYYAPVGEAFPDETDVDYQEAWGGNWVQIAATVTPVMLANDRNEFEAMIQQSTLPIKRVIVDEHYAIETQLAELTATKLSLAVGGSVATTAAGASQRAYEQLSAGGSFTLTERAWGFEGLYKDQLGNQFPIRIFMRKATARLNGQLSFSKAAVAGIPLRVDALGDLSQAEGAQAIEFQRVTAEATA